MSARSPRGAAGALAIAVALGCVASLGGCASMIPLGQAIEEMEPDEVDAVVARVVERYPQVARLSVSESFVIVLDSVIVPPRSGEPWREDDQKLVSAIAAYMLGEEIGRDWSTRVRAERVVVGEGHVGIVVYRSADGRRHMLDASGLFQLFLPLAAAGGRSGAIEATSFDLRVSNQALALPETTGVVEIYGEIIPRNATYTSGGIVYKRWATSLFQLTWGERGASAGPARERDRDRAVAQFLANTRAFIGPVVRLRVRFERGADGLHRLSLGVANPIELVLPSALVSADRVLEDAIDRIARANPGELERRGDNIFVRVGFFFLHPDATGASPADATDHARAAAIKGFRVPAVEKK